jgi:hypothetical protein
MEHFLAERYVPRGARDTVARDTEQLRVVARRVAGTRLLETVYLPTEELCLHLFQSETQDEVALVARLAEVQVDRIRRAEVDA